MDPKKPFNLSKELKKLRKKLRQAETLEQKKKNGDALKPAQEAKLAKKSTFEWQVNFMELAEAGGFEALTGQEKTFFKEERKIQKKLKRIEALESKPDELNDAQLQLVNSKSNLLDEKELIQQKRDLVALLLPKDETEPQAVNPGKVNVTTQQTSVPEPIIVQEEPAEQIPAEELVIEDEGIAEDEPLEEKADVVENLPVDENSTPQDVKGNEELGASVLTQEVESFPEDATSNTPESYVMVNAPKDDDTAAQSAADREAENRMVDSMAVSQDILPKQESSKAVDQTYSTTNDLKSTLHDFWDIYQVKQWQHSEELVARVFAFLGWKTVYKLARVSKTWNAAATRSAAFSTMLAGLYELIYHKPEFYQKCTVSWSKIRQLHLYPQFPQQQSQTTSTHKNQEALRDIAKVAQNVERMDLYSFAPDWCGLEFHKLLLSNAGSLQHLRITHCRVSPPRNARDLNNININIAALPALRKLCIQQSSFDYWHAIPNLQDISWWSDRLDDAALGAMTKHCQKLEVLELVCSPSLSEKAIAECISASCSTLKAIQIRFPPDSGDNAQQDATTFKERCRTISAELLDAILSCKDLEILVLEARLTDHNIWTLIDVFDTKLRILEFGGAGATENGVKMLATHCRGLEVLGLAHCQTEAIRRIDEAFSNLTIISYSFVCREFGNLALFLDKTACTREVLQNATRAPEKMHYWKLSFWDNIQES